MKKSDSVEFLDPAVLDKDGIDHINVYSKGKTKLGRALSHFTFCPFNHPHHGRFVSMEGFWYYIATGFNCEQLKHLSGIQAKELGKTLEKIPYEFFKEEINTGNYLKIRQHPELRIAVKECALPFDHYYVWGNNPPKLLRPSGTQWMMEGLEQCRTALKENKHPLFYLTIKQKYCPVS